MKKDKSGYNFLYKKLGDNIRTIRVNQNLSQEELAFKIHTARNYIGCIERAEKAPSLFIIFEIAKALNVDISQIFLGM